jgi:hypothetical protein
MNKKAILFVITPECSFTRKIEYGTLENLVSSVNELLTSGEAPFYLIDPDDARIRLPEFDGGGTYKWSLLLAHYCFGEGHISETRMVEELFCEENML